jgi:uncharacterized membrane protein YphA (DoxX/SURF4 family)
MGKAKRRLAGPALHPNIARPATAALCAVGWHFVATVLFPLFLMSPSVRNIIAWILQALLAAMFIFGGFSKLKALDDTMKMFGGLGLPGWFGGFIGVAELLGGIGLLVPRTVRPAALCLGVIMIGAVFMHATKIPGGIAKGMPALVALVLLLVVYLLRSRSAVRAV